MIQVLIATNRKDSRSSLLAHNIVQKFGDLNIDAEVMELSKIKWGELESNLYGADNRPTSMGPLVEKLNKADGVYVICPEYNGSYPGAVKTFIDYWDYPVTFEKRPVCFMGIGGMFGGLRPVEHLQQVFGYRNSFVFPERIFIQNVWSEIDEKGEITNDVSSALLKSQLVGFHKFIEGLKHVGLHCNS